MAYFSGSDPRTKCRNDPVDFWDPLGLNGEAQSVLGSSGVPFVSTPFKIGSMSGTFSLFVNVTPGTKGQPPTFSKPIKVTDPDPQDASSLSEFAKGLLKVLDPCDLKTQEIEDDFKEWLLQVAKDSLFPNLPQALVTIGAGELLGDTALNAWTGGTYETTVSANVSFPVSSSINFNTTAKISAGIDNGKVNGSAWSVGAGLKGTW